MSFSNNEFKRPRSEIRAFERDDVSIVEDAESHENVVMDKRGRVLGKSLAYAFGDDHVLVRLQPV